MREFGSGVLGCELPTEFHADAVSCCFPRLDLGRQSCLIGGAPSEELSGEIDEFAFGDIDPGPMFGGVAPLEVIRKAAGLGG